MSEIGFYHLTRTGIEEALPRLLGRTLEAGERAVIRCCDTAQVKALDEALWKTRAPLWLPHGSKDHASRQPVWLTCSDDTPNGARFLFLLDRAPDTGLSQFARVFTLFDGKDEAAVERARALWSTTKQAGHDLAYWQQQEHGWHRAR